MSNIFIQLAFVLGLCSALGYVVQRLRLPLIVAYLVSGVIISVVLNLTSYGQFEILHSLPELGIALVLFLIGMELDLREIKALGAPIIVSSIGQIIISTIGGFALAGYLGFSPIESLYIGLGISFSSTVVVIKLLIEKRDLASLYGKLSLGILLMEDLVAIVALMLISVSGSALNLGFQESLPLLTLIVKALGLFVLTFLLSKYILGRVFTAVARSLELLFLSALTWCFIFTSLAVVAGFSVVIGAFLAGVALATSPYHLQIQSKIKPLRDFFVSLFFVYLGTQVHIADLQNNLVAIVSFTLFALLLKPFLYILLLGIFGFRRHTLFQTGLNLSQISEFSLVLLLVGVSYKVVSPTGLSIMAVVGVLSIIISSILISFSKTLYKLVSPFMGFFEHKSLVHFLEASTQEDKKDHVVIIGAHRVGAPIVSFLQRERIPAIILDFNPHVIQELNKKGTTAIYGDVSDPDVMENLRLTSAKLIISTVQDMTDTEILLDYCRKKRVRAFKVVRAVDIDHAKALKSLGADYVILPEKVSGEYLVDKVRNNWL